MADVETNGERPIPDLPSVSSAPADKNLVDEDSDSDGRRHMSTSVSKTRVSVHTPAEDREAMQQLKQRIDFSDHSVSNSNQGTPKKSAKEPAIENTSTADSGATVQHASEEIAESVSVSTILSRLDTVRNYLKEAEQLHKQLQLKMGEAGAITQLSKISKLIEQLRHQESGYLGILMKVIASAEDDEKQASISDGSDCNGTDSNDNDDDNNDGGDGDEGVDNVESGNPTELQDGGNLSLRSEVAEGVSDGDFLDQERELSVLREQHSLLKKLLEHQRQLKDLELKQSALVEMKQIAEDKLAAECEVLQSQHVCESGIERKDAEKKNADHNGTEDTGTEGQHQESQEGEECKEPKNEEIEYRMLLNKLSELKARKSRVDHLLLLLSELNISPEDLEEGVQTKPEESSTDEVKLDEDQLFLTELEEGTNSSAVQGNEVHSAQSEDIKRPADSQWRTANTEKVEHPEHSKACKRAAEGSSLEDAKLAEYEDRLAEKQAELARLITQRNELMATQKKLLRLQEQSLQEQTGYQQPTQELSYKPTDVTVATWGGSTVPTDDTTSSVSVPVDLDETNDSLDESSPLMDMLNAVGGSAEVEDRRDNKGTLEFRVDRHKLDQETPRKIITPVKQLGSTGKKRKLDEAGVNNSCKAFTSNDPWLSTDETTQTSWPNPTTNNYQEQHVAGLQEQLGFTSHMCSELLKGQNNLIYALCQYSESARHQASAHDQFIQLQQYHSQLQNYHQRLLSSYHKFSSDQAEAECFKQNGISNKSCQPAAKPEGTEADCDPSQRCCGKSEVHIPPPLPPLLFQSSGSFVCPESVRQEFSSSLQSSFPNRKWFYEQPTAGVSQVQSSVAGTTCTSSSYNFTATLPFEQTKMQTGNLVNTSSSVTGSAAQAQASSGPNTPGFLQNIARSDLHPVTATNNFSPDSTGSTLRVSPDSMGNNKGSVDLSHGKMPASGLDCISDKDKATKTIATNSTVVDKEKGGESHSSLPTSLPESLRRGHAELETPVFDSLRETIYSEVAQLIANNESRPHFLVELFRKLQLLNTDYLRQRVLYSIEDLIMRFLTEESVAREEFKMSGKTWAGDSASECTPSETAVTDDEVVSKGPGPQELQNCNAKYDYFEPVDSASSLSTPSEHPYDQFASLNLGNTVIRLDKAMANVQSMHIAEGSPVKKLLKDSQLDTLQTSEVDTHVLDEKIRAVMIEVIPLLKENMANDCTCEMLARIRQYVGGLVLSKEKEHKPEYIEKFAKQLDASLNATLTKFIGKKLEDCGEEILVDISEVLFNELAFFRLMQEVRGYFHHSEFRSVTSASQTTTDNEEDNANVSKQLDLESPHVDQKTGCDSQAEEKQNSSDRREGLSDNASCDSALKGESTGLDSNLTEQDAVCTVSSDTQMAMQTVLQDQFREEEHHLEGCSAVIASIEELEELAGQDENLSPEDPAVKID